MRLWHVLRCFMGYHGQAAAPLNLPPTARQFVYCRHCGEILWREK